MVNRFLSTFGAVAIFALLVGFGGATPAAKVKIPAKAISEIPITHHFSAYFPAVGWIQGGSYPTLIGTMPGTAGVAISQLTADTQAGFVVRIDGNVVFKTPPFYGYYEPHGPVVINPPIIAPPGSVVEIGNTYGPNSAPDLTVTGYTLDPAYFGP